MIESADHFHKKWFTYCVQITKALYIFNSMWKRMILHQMLHSSLYFEVLYKYPSLYKRHFLSLACLLFPYKLLMQVVNYRLYQRLHMMMHRILLELECLNTCGNVSHSMRTFCVSSIINVLAKQMGCSNFLSWNEAYWYDVNKSRLGFGHPNLESSQRLSCEYHNKLNPFKRVACDYSPMPWRQQFNWPAVEFRVWMSNYSPQETLYVFTFPCLNYISSVIVKGGCDRTSLYCLVIITL